MYSRTTSDDGVRDDDNEKKDKPEKGSIPGSKINYDEMIHIMAIAAKEDTIKDEDKTEVNQYQKNSDETVEKTKAIAHNSKDKVLENKRDEVVDKTKDMFNNT